MLHPRLKTRIQAQYQLLQRRGELLTREQIARSSEIFRNRFGPDVLSRLEGLELLETMHGRPGDRRSSLAYCLEFKNDEEIPDYFGSIRGGPASKFGLYIEAATGQWVTRSKRPISVGDAIERATSQRDALCTGAKIMGSLRPDSSLREYVEVDRELRGDARWAYSAWGHKYFTLLYPDLVDNYHTDGWRRFHLVKLAALEDFLSASDYPLHYYATAHPFAKAARELDMHLINLTYTLNSLHGRPHRYFLLRQPKSRRDSAEDRNWLSIMAPDGLDIRLANPSRTKQAQVWRAFAETLSENDIVFVGDGPEVWGVGRVTGGVSRGEAHGEYRRPVRWLTLAPYRVPFGSGNVRPEITPDPIFEELNINDLGSALLIDQIEAHLLDSGAADISPVHIANVNVGKLGRLSEFQLDLPVSPAGYFDKLNISVLVGENGTGKTTLLRFLTDALTSPGAIDGDHSVTFSVRDETSSIGRKGDTVLRPSILPTRVIVSSYSPFEQFDPRSRRHNPVPYVYVGASGGDSLAPAYLPILRALFREDRSTLSERELKQRAAVDRLVALANYGRHPQVQLVKEPVIGNQPRSIQSLMRDDMREFKELLGLKRIPEKVMQPIKRLFDFHVTPPARFDATKLDSYPGGMSGWLEDLTMADRLGIRLIEELWFRRRESWIPLRDLSSGEQSLLYRFFRLLDEVADDAVIIIDEPETHLHPRWILRFVEMLRTVFGEYRAHIILATHSPLIASDLPKQCIACLRIDPDTDEVKAVPIAEETLASSQLWILNQVFGISDALGMFSRKHLDAIEALVAGGHYDQALAELDKVGDSIYKFDLYRRIRQNGGPS